MTSIIIPEEVTYIGRSAFENCGSLTSITISEGVTEIGNYAFYNCSNLTDVTIPPSVTGIGNNAFDDCTGLTSITISEGVTKIGDYAFGGCSGLTSIVIPSSVTNIGDKAFLGCNRLENISVAVENETYNSKDNCNAIIETKSKELIVGCKNTIIPAGVTDIGYCAFSGCRGLTSITIPDGVKRIGYSVFSNCSELTSITIPSSVTSIGSTAFEGCSEELIIYGKSGSYAETYAAENNIKFSGDGSLPQPAEKKVLLDNSIVLSQTSYVYDGQAKKPTVIVKYENVVLTENVDYTVAYQNNVNVGTAKVIVTGQGNYSGTVTKTFTITEAVQKEPEPQPAEKKSLSDKDVTVTFEHTSYVYDGRAKRPSVTVKDKEKVLIENRDYAVTYQNNVNVGTAKAVITGQGNYTGTIERTFTIREAKKNAQAISCKKSYSKTYGDKPFKLNAKITKGNGKLTYKSSNKKVAAVDNKGKVTIKGTGIAEITITAGATSTYNAKSVKVTIKVKPAKQTVKSLKVQSGRKLKVTWKKDKNAAGYEIQYSTDKKFKNKKVTKLTRVNGSKTTAKTLTKLTKGKKYYVRVRAFQNGKVNGKSQRLYGGWSNPKRSGTVKK